MTRPIETRPTRLAALAKLPIFLDLAGKRVVVAGGGEPVAWKAELFAAAGAQVTVFAEQPCAELVAFIRASGSAVTLERRAWRESDLDGAWLAVADAEDPDEAARFAAAARARGILVNVIDQPAHCDFQFGAIVNRSPVVVGISTDGAAPILGQAIRRRIEAILPASLGSLGASRSNLPRSARRPPAHEGGAPSVLGTLRRCGVHAAGRRRTGRRAGWSGSRTKPPRRRPDGRRSARS